MPTIVGKTMHSKHAHAPSGAADVNAAPEEVFALKRRILIVEDEDDARQQLQHLLEADADLQIDSTGNGKTALEWLTERNYSIVLTDLRMAGLDGMDLIREIQQRGLPVTVIVMTGDTSI